MILPLPLEARARITEAVESVWSEASLPPDPARPRIVPLEVLIQAQPLIVREVANLTARTAVAYMEAAELLDNEYPATATNPLAGFLYAGPQASEVWGYIFVNAGDPVERRRFSIAHELGHYLLHFLPAIRQAQQAGEELHMIEEHYYSGSDGDDIPQGSLTHLAGEFSLRPLPTTDYARMEAEANQFAADLLMPVPACRTLRAAWSGRDNPRRFATTFLVSTAAMRRRLADLLAAA